LATRRVNTVVNRRRRVEHGLPTAALGRFVASADRPPPWTTLHYLLLNIDRRVVQ